MLQVHQFPEPFSKLFSNDLTFRIEKCIIFVRLIATLFSLIESPICFLNIGETNFYIPIRAITP
jgi:hypothetical protein